ncbi:hypothetical protein FJT64_012735 [Amphibalanus amphitrite]|uniref:Uncharacterized protein n=1 Tax=Amphibalanus amphitrite TaxID=1232801 RepID=A0A6A4V2Q3_AMPAM|nr:hypothetical protein FJT64_012735 [Amphibalanus amphitrite]
MRSGGRLPGHPQSSTGEFCVGYTIRRDPGESTGIQVTNGTISGGLQGMLLSHIQNHLGFSMSFTPIPGVNGSSHWGRTFSVIRDGLFDLSPSSWTVSHARHALVDFTFPTVTVTVGFGIRTPDAETDTTAFLRPFDESAYAGVVLLLVLLATAAWLLDNRSRLLADRCPSCFVPLKGVPPEERAIIFRKGLDAEHGIMNRQLLRLWEGGVLARERAYWLPETLSESYRCHPGARGWDAIAVSQVYPLFVLLLTSAAASLLILAAEIVHFRWSKNGRKRGTSRS